MVILIETEMAVHKLIFGQPFLLLSDMPQAASAFLNSAYQLFLLTNMAFFISIVSPYVR